jgi:ribosomal protein S18 acetylase RimI-like enzyme
MIAAMEPIRLRPMTEAEFSSFRVRLIRDYAADHVRAGHWAADRAEVQSAEQVDGLLPEGLATPDMLLFSAETADGSPLGIAWVALGKPRPGDAWLYDIEINPEHRGKGYGRALLQAAERESAKRGAKAIGLNVFGVNTTARSLYESAGYEITAFNMRKELSEPELGHP